MSAAIGPQFSQFLFFRQWQRLKSYANERHPHGDIRFVSSDSPMAGESALFAPIANGGRRRRRRFDYFVGDRPALGQSALRLARDGKELLDWWIARFRSTFSLVDVVRLDHFRGFEAYWEIPAGSPNAIKGRWIKAPGIALMETLKKTFGPLPIIAEDLGVITPEVDAMRRRFELPGMRILQFAFGDRAENRFLPHNYDLNTIVYTGTHDNDTTWGGTVPPTSGSASRAPLSGATVATRRGT